MQVTGVLTDRFLIRPPVGLFEESLTGVAERTVGDVLPFLKLLPAQGTLLVELKTSLQTLPTEAVATRQQHGVPVDALTNGTGQVLLERYRLFRHVFIHTVSHGFTGPLQFTFVIDKPPN